MESSAMVSEGTTSEKIAVCTAELSCELHSLRAELYPPEAQKSFTRTYTTPEVEKILGVPQSTLRTLSIDGRGPVPERAKNGTRMYTLEQMKQLRHYLAVIRPDDALRLVPRRREGESIQIGSPSVL